MFLTCIHIRENIVLAEVRHLIVLLVNPVLEFLLLGRVIVHDLLELHLLGELLLFL